MSRRRSEQEFGSDSFLDIVANVVGILIILIVVAGVRVGRMPVLPDIDETPEVASAVIAPQPEPPPILSLPAPVPLIPVPVAETIVIDEPAPPPPEPQVIVVEKPLPALPAPEAPRELVRQAEALQQSISQLDATRVQLEQSLKSQAERRGQTESKLESAQSEVQSEAERRQQEQQELAAGQRELTATLAQLDRLKQLLAEADVEPAAKTIQHRMTPIGKVVIGQELHYYLSGGRIAYVPVDELALRLQAQIQRQKDLLARMERYEGSVDPLEGFRMEYVIQRSRLSLSEELKFGQNVVRMQVTKWTLLPEPDLVTESPAQALREGSRFYQSLLSAGPTATLTMWVYPDSFEASAEVKEFAHRHGYEVALRPLPIGVPISGSPDGSKSIAQ
ncbi:MAG: hypothetical protein KDA75_01955 [Planctomycetaceae bacterium]|nr:hypothetical protein [Planctomycetaceae bacterium]